MIVQKSSDFHSTDVERLHEGKKYHVYAILFGEQTKFLIEDDDVFSFPFYVSANEVEIIDNAVSVYWKYSNPLNKTDIFSSRPAMLACEKMLERSFYQDIVNGEERAKTEWELIKAKIDAELSLSCRYSLV